MLCWLVNCSFQWDHTQLREWQVRLIGTQRALLPSSFVPPAFEADSSSGDAHRTAALEEIYLRGDGPVASLTLIGRAIVDEEFHKFVTKLPLLIAHYHKRQATATVDLHHKLELRIKQSYWAYYNMFKESYNLKLNYSIK